MRVTHAPSEVSAVFDEALVTARKAGAGRDAGGAAPRGQRLHGYDIVAAARCGGACFSSLTAWATPAVSRAIATIDPGGLDRPAPRAPGPPPPAPPNRGN
jgi:hypothetical protein